MVLTYRITSILTTKDKNWRYEQEVRLIINNHEEFNWESFSIGATPLKAIIYGTKTSEEDKDTISEILAKDFE